MAFLCGCNIAAGFTADCNTLLSIGGLYNYAYVFNICDLDDTAPITIDQSGYVTDFTFKPQKGFYKFVSKNDSFAAGYEVLQGEGSAGFTQRVEMRLFSKTPAQDKVIKNSLVASLGIVVATANDEVKFFGWRKGLRLATGTQTSGFTQTDSTADTLTFEGGFTDPFLRVLDGNFAGTLAMLESKLAA